MHINVDEIDRETFDISPRGKYTLITPTKFKHIWAPEELHLRSLLLDENGMVISSGFPKFHNCGEKEGDEEVLYAAMKEGRVSLREKVDGSLVILSYYDGAPHFRTRGNDTLGDFEEPVMKLFNEKYADFMTWYVSSNKSAVDIRHHYSLLFEYVGPDNQIVIKYDEPDLYLLGAVRLSHLDVFTAAIMQHVVPHVRTPKSIPVQELSEVKNWKEREGVVAEILPLTNGPSLLMKVKSEQYLKLHAIKSRLGSKAHIAKTVYLLDIQDMSDAQTKFARLGIDWESMAIIYDDLAECLAQFYDTRWMFHQFRALVENIRNMDFLNSSETMEKKTFVEVINSILKDHSIDYRWFHAAMRIYNGKWEDGLRDVIAWRILDESPIAVRNWKVEDLNDMLNAEVIDAP